MTQKYDPTAERFSVNEEKHFPQSIAEQHLARYEFAKAYVRDKRVLDAACGTGYGSAILCDAGAREVVGIDLSAEAVAHASESFRRPNLRFETGDAQSLAAHPDESFDVVISFETIEHLPDDAAYLKEVHRVLRRGGIYIVSTPDGRVSSTLFGLTGKPNNEFHVREYVRSDFRKLLEQRFVLKALYGQVFVPKLLVPWPVQLFIKGVERATRPLKVFRGMTRIYHYGSGTHVQPETDHPSRIAKYWIAVCEKAA